MENSKKYLFMLLVFLIQVIPTFSQVSSENKNRFQFPISVHSTDYLQKTIIVKVRPEYASMCALNTIENPVFKKLYVEISGVGLMKKFPFVKAPQKSMNEKGERLIDLTLIYQFSYSGNLSLEKTINKFLNTQLFEYVEPHYLPHLCYTPNDTLLSSQYGIVNIQAENAWSVNTTTARGDTNVVIGITDTGTDPLHNDLKTQIKHNYSDVPGGGDTDGDGYLDNFSGWDLGENDNDPTWTANPHGVHVSGIAAAAVDNITGVAGVGFKCKFLPVKIADAGGALTQAYEGVVYAADHGCAIISCPN